MELIIEAEEESFNNVVISTLFWNIFLIQSIIIPSSIEIMGKSLAEGVWRALTSVVVFVVMLMHC